MLRAVEQLSVICSMYENLLGTPDETVSLGSFVNTVEFLERPEDGGRNTTNVDLLSCKNERAGEGKNDVSEQQ